MNEIHQQETHKGFNINIYRDESPESPRGWDNLGTFYTAHRRYCPEKELDANFNIHDIFSGKIGDFKDSFLQKYIVLPIYLYDHSGQTVSTSPFSCKWDSGFFGIVAVDIEKVKKAYNWKKVTKKRRTQIESYLENEVKLYDMYCTGDVYGYKITEVDNDDNELDHSCWGFFGDDGIKQLTEDAKRLIDYHLNELTSQKRQSIIDNFKKYGKQLFLFPEMDATQELELITE